MIFSFPSY